MRTNETSGNRKLHGNATKPEPAQNSHTVIWFVDSIPDRLVSSFCIAKQRTMSENALLIT